MQHIPTKTDHLLKIRFYTFEDYPKWVELFSNMLPKQNQWDWEPEESDKLTVERFTRKLNRHLQERRQGLVYYFCIEELVAKNLIGIGLINLNPQKNSAEIGFQISNKYWGKGFGTEACRLLIQTCQQDLKISRIVAKVNIKNTASIKIVEKLGIESSRESEGDLEIWELN